MFYYPTVLQHRTGCFSTIWLVATKSTKVTRRDFLKVNVIRTSEDIMSYVLEQVPAPGPGLPRPRFSLYLSSQLQYGLILVYHRQCTILLQELQSILRQLVKRKSQQIDLAEQGRQAVDLPDALGLLEETDGAPDPLFGLMQHAIPSPNTLLQFTGSWREISPEFPEPDAARGIGITASPDTITLKEIEPVAIPVAEFEGEELVDQSLDTIRLLMAQGDDFLKEDLEMQREEAAPEEQQLTPISVPAMPSPPSAAKEPQRPALQAEDEPLPEVELGRRKRRRTRRRRQLTFFDPETQINREEQREMIDDPLMETRPPLFPPLPSQRMLSVAELFNNPCTFLPEEVEFLWGRAAIIRPLSDSDLQVGASGSTESTESSEREREPEMMEAAEVAEVATTVTEEEEIRKEVLKDVPRPGDVAEPEVDISDQGSVALERFDQAERSQEIISPIPTFEREGLLPKHDEASVLFRDLLQPDADRQTVINIFLGLLGALSAKKIRAEQDEPYGDIVIFPGPTYGEGLQNL